MDSARGLFILIGLALVATFIWHTSSLMPPFDDDDDQVYGLGRKWLAWRLGHNKQFRQNQERQAEERAKIRSLYVNVYDHYHDHMGERGDSVAAEHASHKTREMK